MFCTVRTMARSRRLFCSSSSLSSLQSRLSSNTPPSTGVLYQRRPIRKNVQSPIYGFSAPSTTCISPIDVAYSRFMNRHAPLEVANRLLKMADKKEARPEVFGESTTWQSATGMEYEIQRIPLQALDHLQKAVGRGSTSGTLQQADVMDDTSDEADAPGQASGLHGGVIVVSRDFGGKDFYENLMSALQEGLEKSGEYEMTSTKRKRRLKMNKHKFKKRRKEQESVRRKLGK